MNPFRWLLNLSAAAAENRGGHRDPRAFSYDSSVDSREYEEWVEVDGIGFFVGNKKEPERWTELSADKSRYASVTQSADGSFRLHVFERSDKSWRSWEGPSIVASLEEAQVLGQKLLNRNQTPEEAATLDGEYMPHWLHMSDHKFYLDIDPLGTPHAVFRSPMSDGFERGELERAMPDGSWSGAEKDVRYLFDLWLKGDFDPEDDEVSEERAMAQIEKWRTTRTWPGPKAW